MKCISIFCLCFHSQVCIIHYNSVHCITKFVALGQSGSDAVTFWRDPAQETKEQSGGGAEEDGGEENEADAVSQTSYIMSF